MHKKNIFFIIMCFCFTDYLSAAIAPGIPAGIKNKKAEIADLDIRLQYNGMDLYWKMANVPLGKKISLPIEASKGKNMFVEVIPLKKGEATELHFFIGKLLQTNENSNKKAKRILEANPQIVALNGMAASLEIRERIGRSLSLSALVKR